MRLLIKKNNLYMLNWIKGNSNYIIILQLMPFQFSYYHYWVEGGLFAQKYLQSSKLNTELIK